MSGTIIQAIPAADIVQVNPSVISGGGAALELSGLVLTDSWRVPIGAVYSFPTAAAVAAFFGPTTLKATMAATYFLGYNNSTAKPGAMLFAQYNTLPVGAWLLGGSIAAQGMTLAQLQALSGTIALTINGTLYTSSPINLSSATSFSNAAELMSIGLGLVGATAASFTGAIAGSTLTVSALTSGAVAVGQEVRGSGVTAGTVVSALLTGTGGNGTYSVTITQTVSSGPLTTVVPTISYDPISGGFLIVSPTTGAASTITFATANAFTTALNLTAATGATISQGAIAAVPASFMASVVADTQNWCSFTSVLDPDAGAGNAQKQLFAAWVNSTNNRYLYVAWDTDLTPTLSMSATASLGGLLKANNSSGTALISSQTQGPIIASFLMGAIASINFAATNGRQDLDFTSQSGITPDITNQTIATNLRANLYNFYGAWATANQVFEFFNPGQVTGQYAWIDSYVNQIWLNNQFQLDLLELVTTVGHIPYNPAGYALIKASLKDTTNQAINFGAIAQGVTLSSTQIAEVNAAAGLAIDTTLATQGWYLQVLDPTVQVRKARGTPQCNFFYMDGESIQSINLASVLIQ